VLLPFLFYLNASLAWAVLTCFALIVLVVLVYLHPLRRAFARVIAAETEKASALGETVFRVQTMKSRPSSRSAGYDGWSQQSASDLRNWWTEHFDTDFRPRPFAAVSI